MMNNSRTICEQTGGFPFQSIDEELENTLLNSSNLSQNHSKIEQSTSLCASRMASEINKIEESRSRISDHMKRLKSKMEMLSKQEPRLKNSVKKYDFPLQTRKIGCLVEREKENMR